MGLSDHMVCRFRVSSEFRSVAMELFIPLLKVVVIITPVYTEFRSRGSFIVCYLQGSQHDAKVVQVYFLALLCQLLLVIRIKLLLDIGYSEVQLMPPTLPVYLNQLMWSSSLDWLLVLLMNVTFYMQ